MNDHLRTLRSVRVLMQTCLILLFLGVSMIPPYIPRMAYSTDAEYSSFTSNQFLLVEEGFVMKTASISEQGYRIAYSRGISHRVGSGESIMAIAELYQISSDTLLWANSLREGDIIRPGDTLLILPVDGVLHTVKRGQSLTKIAELYAVHLGDIMKQNQLNEQIIHPGQKLIIPHGKPLVDVVSPPSLLARGRTDTLPLPPRPVPAPPGVPPPSFGVLQKPCDCTYTQSYRPGHYAVDMARTGGGPIFASEDGVVIRADYGWNGGYGTVVELDHGNGLVTLYAHNRELHVREGMAVRRGDVIASMGKTGRVYGTTGVHLHFEVILNGVKKNPILYLQ